MASPSSSATLPPAAMREWRHRLLRGEWRVFDLEFFHVVATIVNVATALLVTTLVVAMTKHDGSVKVSVLFVALLVAGLVFVRAAARAGLRAAERRTAALATAAARRELLDALSRGAHLRPGIASTFVTRSAVAVGEYLAQAVPTRAVAIPLPLATLALLALIDPWSALIAASLVAIVCLALIAFGRRAAAEAAAGLVRLRSLSARALELLYGAVELRSLGALARGRDELAAATDRMVASTRRALRLGLLSGTALDVLAGGAIGLVAMAAGFRLLDGSLGLGHALAAVLLTAEVFVPLRAVGAAFHASADGRAAIVMLDEVCREARPVRDEPTGALPAIATCPAVCIARRVSLRAAVDAPTVVEGIDLAVPAGGSLVVLGPSGSGKSTLLRAICGAPLVTAGWLRLGNADPAGLSARQRSALIAVVDQRPFLVAGSIRDNLVLGIGDAGDDAIAAAAARCHLGSLLARAPRGLDEQVGDEGRLLSAGERTKVVLARALLRDPGVLLLDEVGAHLDDDTIAVLRRSLASFLTSRTVIEVAHDRPLLTNAATLHLGQLAAVS